MKTVKDYEAAAYWLCIKECISKPGFLALTDENKGYEILNQWSDFKELYKKEAGWGTLINRRK